MYGVTVSLKFNCGKRPLRLCSRTVTLFCVSRELVPFVLFCIKNFISGIFLFLNV